MDINQQLEKLKEIMPIEEIRRLMAYDGFSEAEIHSSFIALNTRGSRELTGSSEGKSSEGNAYDHDKVLIKLRTFMGDDDIRVLLASEGFSAREIFRILSNETKWKDEVLPRNQSPTQYTTLSDSYKVSSRSSSSSSSSSSFGYNHISTLNGSLMQADSTPPSNSTTESYSVDQPVASIITRSLSTSKDSYDFKIQQLLDQDLSTYDIYFHHAYTMSPNAFKIIEATYQRLTRCGFKVFFNSTHVSTTAPANYERNPISNQAQADESIVNPHHSQFSTNNHGGIESCEYVKKSKVIIVFLDQPFSKCIQKSSDESINPNTNNDEINIQGRAASNIPTDMNYILHLLIKQEMPVFFIYLGNTNSLFQDISIKAAYDGKSHMSAKHHDGDINSAHSNNDINLEWNKALDYYYNNWSIDIGSVLHKIQTENILLSGESRLVRSDENNNKIVESLLLLFHKLGSLRRWLKQMDCKPSLNVYVKEDVEGLIPVKSSLS